MSVSDHLVEQIPPLQACALIAHATTRIRMGTLVLNNDFRHPVLLAREAATVAEISGGRFELGLGAGHMRAEYQRAGLRFDPHPVRAARLEESARIVRALLAGGPVTFEGSHYAVRDERCWPVPAQPVPLLVGGNSEAVHRCAARHADIAGLIGFGHRRGGTAFDNSAFTAQGLERQLARLRRLAGERFVRLELQALVQWTEVTGDRRAAAERLAAGFALPTVTLLESPYVLLGTAAEIADQLRGRSERFGVRRWTILSGTPGHPPPETLAPVVDRVRAG